MTRTEIRKKFLHNRSRKSHLTINLILQSAIAFGILYMYEHQ